MSLSTFSSLLTEGSKLKNAENIKLPNYYVDRITIVKNKVIQ